MTTWFRALTCAAFCALIPAGLALSSTATRASKAAPQRVPAKPAPSKLKSSAAKKPSAAPKSSAARKPAAKTSSGAKKTAKRRSPVRRTPWRQPTYADAALGDRVDGEDTGVRRAAVQALGPYNGSVVVVDSANGRILTVVNQKLAFQSGFTPCSTIKIVTALAALSEGVIERTTPVRLSRRLTLDLTTALAQSHLSNGYFGGLGKKVGFERVRHYAEQCGLGERAGWDIPEEQPGTFPSHATISDVGLMTSFGTGISQTPLQLAAFLAAVANGGTLYYLQYPRTQEEIDSYVPRVKRELPMHPWLEDLRIGMRAAVDSGTGRRANYDGHGTVLGKTGTCTDFGQAAHLGWFGAYNEGGRELVVVVLLTGGRAVNGPMAAGIAGQVYRQLADAELLTVEPRLNALACCGQ